MPRFARLLFFTAGLFLLTLCTDQDQVVPYVKVNISIYLYDPEFSALQGIGNSIAVTGGVSGILIYRLSMEEFLAFDRTCTHNVDDFCQVFSDDSGLFAVDTFCCGSKFLLLDGSVVKGPAKYPLKQYNTYFDGQYLTVYN